jgi:hypothetical protein
MKNRAIIFAIVASAASATAFADLVEVRVVGSVDFGGVPGGQWADAGPGDEVIMSFLLDSDVFVDSMNFPTRGYEIMDSSFNLSIGGNSAGLADPYPAGRAPLFVIRNDDPGVDGFFLGSSVDGFDDGVATDEGAFIANTFDALFSATYEAERLDSLDILGAVGTYDFTGLSVFNWGLEDEFVQPMGFIFDEWTISVVPAPASLALLTTGGLVFSRRRR